VGIALALRFADGRGLLHGAVKVDNVCLMRIRGFKSRTSVRSAWKWAKWNRFREKVDTGGGRLRICLASF
jgi:hypothetical protein